MSLEVVLIYIVVLVVTYLLLRYYCVFSPFWNLIDVPNHRSSHKKPIPRGAGICMAVGFFFGLCFLFFFDVIELQWLLPLAISVPLVTIIGFLDDRKSLSPGLRFGMQFSSALLAIVALTDLLRVPLETDFLPINSQIALVPLTILFIGWMINLYNFMDGIDGLAGIEGFTVSIWAMIITFLQGYYEQFYLYTLLLAVLAVFLWFNWYPAKVFMGDAGSYFLGSTFAVLALMGDQYTGMSVATNIILLAAFIVDASYTLIVRYRQGDNLTHAHKTFGFHKARKRGFRVSKIAFCYGAFNLFYLGPIAMLTIKIPEYSWLLVIIAFAPIVVFVSQVQAGKE